MTELDGGYNAARNQDRRGGPDRQAVTPDALAALDVAYSDRWGSAVARVAPRVALAIEFRASWSASALARWIAAEWLALVGSDEPPLEWVRALPELGSAVRSSRSLQVAAAPRRGRRGPPPRIDRARLRALVDRGWTDQDLAAQFGAALGTVRRLRRESGVLRAPERPSPESSWRPHLAAYRAARAEGLSSPAALERIGAQLEDVLRWRRAEQRQRMRGGR